MKKGVFLFFALILSSVPACAGKWKSFDAGMAEGRERNLPVLVDFSAEWCGWCEKMDDEVFSRPDIAKRMSAGVIAVRIDVDSSESFTYKGKKMNSSEFAKLMKVDGIPALVVLDPQENPVAELKGFADAPTFSALLDFLESPCWKSVSFQQYLRSGCPQSPKK
ncbi:MAG: thioredoxin family protein [Spirochaetota bacterium]